MRWATRCIGNASNVGNVLTLEEDSSGNPNPPSRPVTLDDDDYDDDDDDDYNVISAGLGHMCPNPQNGLFQCF